MSEVNTAGLTVDLTVQDYEAFITRAHWHSELKRRRLRGHAELFRGGGGGRPWCWHY